MHRGPVSTLVVASFLLSGVAFVASGMSAATRGLGVYPGDPAEDFSPTLVPAAPGRRNLALHRAATQSSAYDYDLVAQLVTDGVVERTLPRWLATSTSADGPVPKHQRSYIFDGNKFSGIELHGRGWIGIELGGGDQPLQIDRIELGLRKANWIGPAIERMLGLPQPPPGVCVGDLAGYQPPEPLIGAENLNDGEMEWSLLGSVDGRTWEVLGHATMAVPETAPPPPAAEGPAPFMDWTRDANPITWTGVDLEEATSLRRFRMRLEDLDCKPWQVAELRFFRGGERILVGGPHDFSSAWRSAGLGEEWVAVDLGASARVDAVVLHWLRAAAEGAIEVSDDGAEWTPVAELGGAGGREEITLREPVEARHLRVVMRRPVTVDGYVLTELEVLGEGGVGVEPHPPAAPAEDGSVHLAGGRWRLQRDAQVAGDARAVSTPGYDDASWIVATVPGTVLTSYVNVGAVADPNYGDNELTISDSFFHSDFWYRTEIDGPSIASGSRVFLELDGVNWKAEVHLNGASLGRVEGAFQRGRFDVTDHLRAGAPNALAIRIERQATPGATKQHTLADAGWNGGAIGADNPSYHASIGWDWIPTIRGRNIGLWNDVRLTVTGPATIEDPFLRYTLPLPDTSRADAYLDVTLENHGDAPFAGVLRGRIGDLARFEQPVEIDAGASVDLALDPSNHPALRLEDPELWWPNGHGAPHLYQVELELASDAGVSDRESFASGVRQITYTEEVVVPDEEEVALLRSRGRQPREEKAIRLWVNGQRVVPRGGNWGFPEANLRYRGREYETAMRYHRDMHFTMVRNWVGQTGDDELYEAADRNGILIWQDFWLANPYDGPDPDDEPLFVRNVRDTIRRIRNHPSVALYCARNEGYPPPVIDAGIAGAISELHPGLPYVPNSMFGSVSGGGPYGVRSKEFYFAARATPKLHSELGMTSVVTADSLALMMPEDELWPMGLAWGLHDFNLLSNQKAKDYVDLIEEGYGGADGLRDWVATAQLVNYDGYRAMFEAQSRRRMGLQLWMSHPAWPSLTWQTYDYYFNPHASYFGSKKGAEPLHVQWNPLSDEVEVVNYGVGDFAGLTAAAEVLGTDGTVVWSAEAVVDSASDSTVAAFEIDFPEVLDPVHFLRLRLSEGDTLRSENTYWRGTEPGDYRALRTLPEVEVAHSTTKEHLGDRWVLETVLVNRGASPALAVRVVAVRSNSGDRILPALYSDNFVVLMPGETRTIHTELLEADARGEQPRVVVEGYNLRL